MRKGLVVTFLVVAALLASLIFLTGGQAAKMAAKAHGFLFPSYSQQYAVHTVSVGQTLWEVAWSYMDKQDKHRDVRYLVDDIRRQNNMMGNELQKKWQPGQEIVIPLNKEVGI